MKGEWHLEFTFEKIVVDIERTPFAVEVILGTSDDQNSGWERRNVRKSSFQTSSRAEGDMKQGSREGAVPLCPTRTCLPLVPTFRRARVTLGFDFHGPGPKAKRDER